MKYGWNSKNQYFDLYVSNGYFITNIRALLSCISIDVIEKGERKSRGKVSYSGNEIE